MTTRDALCGDIAALERKRDRLRQDIAAQQRLLEQVRGRVAVARRDKVAEAMANFDQQVASLSPSQREPPRGVVQAVAGSS